MANAPCQILLECRYEVHARLAVSGDCGAKVPSVSRTIAAQLSRERDHRRCGAIVAVRQSWATTLGVGQCRYGSFTLARHNQR